jgi:hypothetical protein
LTELHGRLNGLVKTVIASRLGSQAWDEHLVDELAEEPWRWLSQRRAVLYGFDPARGTVTVYFRVLSEEAVHRHFRRQRSRSGVQIVPMGKLDLVDPNSREAELVSTMTEFGSTLTGSKAIWWQVAILGKPMPDGKHFSAGYWRELESEVLQKCAEFVTGTGG